MPPDPSRRRYRVADVAAQAGLSRATVDRVLHSRAGVRPETVAQVERALDELDRQQTLIHLSRSPTIVDVVVQAPDRFVSALRAAIELELAGFRPALVRARFRTQETSDPGATVKALEAVLAHGSGGVLLKAPDHPSVAACVVRLARAGVPTVTFATDVSQACRVAYVGVDNHASGATAAYLTTMVDPEVRCALVTMSSSTFLGEEERLRGFVDTLGLITPRCEVVVVTDTDGLDGQMRTAVQCTLAHRREASAVYSIGGANRATLAAFDELGLRPRVFVAHDLDDDNVALLRTRRVTFVLHHDLRSDVRRACGYLLQARGVLPGHPADVATQVQVVTPFNEPRRLPLVPPA